MTKSKKAASNPKAQAPVKKAEERELTEADLEQVAGGTGATNNHAKTADKAFQQYDKYIRG